MQIGIQDYDLWTSYWHDDTHGKVQCWASDCSYNPYGAGAIMLLDDSKFECIDNVWKYNGQLVNGEELYCKEHNVPLEILESLKN